MHQLGKPAQVQSNINVTPLVDVVLVLLIIFMIITPQLANGPSVQLPTTDEPPPRPDDGRQIMVVIEPGGFVWVEGDRMPSKQLPAGMATVAEDKADWQVVIKGDARLTFGEVQRAMLAIEAAGFTDVGLIAERRDAGGE